MSGIAAACASAKQMCSVFSPHRLFLRWDVVITDIICFSFKDPLTQQPQCFLTGPAGIAPWSQCGLDLHGVNIFKEPTLIWGICCTIVKITSLKFLPIFNIRPTGIFWGNVAECKNLSRFLWVSFSFFSRFPSSTLYTQSGHPKFQSLFHFWFLTGLSISWESSWQG